MIVCLGTTPALQRTMAFDRMNVGDVNRAKSVKQFASGKSVNVARVLHALGEHVMATGIVGGGSGKFLRDDLDQSGIPHDFVESPAPTRTCITLLDESTNTATELIEEPPDTAGKIFDELLDKLAHLLTGATVLVLSGSLAPGAGDDFYARCLKLAHDQDVATILDATGAPLKLALAEKPIIVKPNRAELAATLGTAIETDEQLHDALQQVIKLGASWVVVSDGTNNVRVCNGETTWSITVPPVKAINPIGSGDALCAGIAAGIVRKMNVPQAAALGVASGAANALTPHAGHINRLSMNMLREKAIIALDLPPLPPRPT